MKLRIKDNSLRVRLTRSEVAALLSLGNVEQQTLIGQATLATRVQLDDSPDPLATELRDQTIYLLVSKSAATAWAGNDDAVSLSREQPLTTGGVLRLLLEKDFKLHPAAR